LNITFVAIFEKVLWEQWELSKQRRKVKGFNIAEERNTTSNAFSLFADRKFVF
jgi:hypothetical protein